MAKLELLVASHVRLTRKFLRNTGQVVGGEGSKRWTILGFERDWAIVDEEVLPGSFTAEEIAADPSLKYRRIAVANLEVILR